jgi:hypothetical protein
MPDRIVFPVWMLARQARIPTHGLHGALVSWDGTEHGRCLLLFTKLATAEAAVAALQLADIVYIEVNQLDQLDDTLAAVGGERDTHVLFDAVAGNGPRPVGGWYHAITGLRFLIETSSDLPDVDDEPG